MTVKVREINPGKWYVQIDYHRFRKTKFISTNKERADEVAKRLQEALDLYGFDALVALEKARKPEKKIPTLRAYADKWELELEQTDLRLSTRSSYIGMMKKHIVPALGTLKLTEIDYSKLKEFAIAKSKTHSRDSVRLMLASARALMQEALKDKHIRINPVAGLARFYRGAKRRREEMDPFTVEDLKKIETKFRERFPEALVFFLLLSRTGLRIGEGIALQWRDIDWDKSEIIVRRNLPQHRHLERTKTRSSERRVDMIPRLAEELRLWHKQRTAAYLKAGRILKADDWIWTTSEGTPLRYSNFVRRIWNRVQALAEVRQRSPHDLRHTWASQMLAAGADPAWVARQLGHSSPLVTLRIYAHYVPGSKRVSAEVLDGQTGTQITRKRKGFSKDLGDGGKR
jgi:integrase